MLNGGLINDSHQINYSNSWRRPSVFNGPTSFLLDQPISSPETVQGLVRTLFREVCPPPPLCVCWGETVSVLTRLPRSDTACPPCRKKKALDTERLRYCWEVSQLHAQLKTVERSGDKYTKTGPRIEMHTHWKAMLRTSMPFQKDGGYLLLFNLW